ncbi:hypothetical protein GCM10011608_09630 [Micromonospora sonchi]|uniref:Uncharacterized protein n=1 Tax=Micromonospora sonchi TaxID=1763543 RepID=A0A917WT30_9ACTN|nr:hypothetical protein [Micromonospora sonchi]GGM26916.1 hypothetical protein GCM10011608_09630 [Micromonospora sonchi]
MSDKLYTDADVAIAVAAIARSWGYDSVAAMDAVPDQDAPMARAEARAVLDALVADGWRRAGAAPDTAAAGTTGPNWSHEIAFDDTGDWSIGHPDGCPGQAGGDCDVQRLAFGQVDAGFFNRYAGHRYRCDVNDLRDRFLFGARIENEPAGLAPWDRYDDCGRCVLVAALGGPVRVTQADCPTHGINPTTQPEETTMTPIDLINQANKIAPIPAVENDATRTAWIRHYAALALAAYAALRAETSDLPRNPQPGSRPDIGYLAVLANSATAATAALDDSGDAPNLIWDLTPEAGALNGEWEEWLAEVLVKRGINPGHIDPDLDPADFTPATV